MTEVMRGAPLAAALREAVEADVGTLADAGATPTLGTVLMSDDPAARSFMDRKHEACAALGIETERVTVPPDAPAASLYDAVDRLARDGGVTALFVQVPLPAHVDAAAVRERIPPAKDVDCFAPANLGRLVGGTPRVTPATPAAVLRLLDAYDVETAGRDVVVVGRTTTICKPLSALLVAPDPGPDATVTVCHTSTADLGAHTRRADVLVTAAGEPGLVDASMVSRGVSVVDISATRVDEGDGDGGGSRLVGDVDFASVKPKADAITPVPGGVGPLTLACLLRNVVDVTARQSSVEDACGDGWEEQHR
jgi:methylenetetrahydrofolate dehydrogenase (NADP+)/methenyltetrahydrofolate cyclohydrolase